MKLAVHCPPLVYVCTPGWMAADAAGAQVAAVTGGPAAARAMAASGATRVVPTMVRRMVTGSPSGRGGAVVPAHPGNGPARDFLRSDAVKIRRISKNRFGRALVEDRARLTTTACDRIAVYGHAARRRQERHHPRHLVGVDQAGE